MSTDTGRVDAALHALAGRNRRAILNEVRQRPRAVGEIAERIAISQQAVSHHLRVLRHSGLVSESRDGTRHLFSVNAGGFAAVQEYLEGFWPSRLTALKRAAEATARKDHRARV